MTDPVRSAVPPADRREIMICVGTRPEAIKLAPVVDELGRRASLDVHVLATAQHRELLDQVLETFHITPDADLGAMRPGQTLPELTARLVTGISDHIRTTKPHRVIVQGDTTTAFCAALAAFYEGVPVAHVEAGLRTSSKRSPFPEEMNRRLVSGLADLHFAPTERNACSLRAEGVPASAVHVVGNTVIDALHAVLPTAERHSAARRVWDPASERRLVLVTGHRRENFGDGQAAVCRGLARLAEEHRDIDIVYPVHPNPRVREVVDAAFADAPNISLVAPLDYLTFVALMKWATFIVSDSGGVQEEAPALGTPVLVTRASTERPEAIEAGGAVLVGTDEERLLACGRHLLESDRALRDMVSAGSPFGDGRAAARIADVLENAGAPVPESGVAEVT